MATSPSARSAARPPPAAHAERPRRLRPRCQVAVEHSRAPGRLGRARFSSRLSGRTVGQKVAAVSAAGRGGARSLESTRVVRGKGGPGAQRARCAVRAVVVSGGGASAHVMPRVRQRDLRLSAAAACRRSCKACCRARTGCRAQCRGRWHCPRRTAGAADVTGARAEGRVAPMREGACLTR